MSAILNKKKGHLIILRSKGEGIYVGEGHSQTKITVTKITEGRVTLECIAPRSIKIDREEIRKIKNAKS